MRDAYAAVLESIRVAFAPQAYVVDNAADRIAAELQRAYVVGHLSDNEHDDLLNRLIEAAR